MAKNITYQQLEQQHHFQTYKRFPVTLVEGKGCKVWDDQGNEYLDALAGVAVNALGHCHPNVVKAIQEQAEKLIHVSNFYHHPMLSLLAKKLSDLTGLDKAFFCNSGAEAMEGAIKLARKYGYNKGKQGPIISMENCFHGRTIATVSMGRKKYQEGFGPMPGGFEQIPLNDEEALEHLVSKDPIAIVVEPVQGEGGIHVANSTFLQKARKICSDNDILLILDEIQCGTGRTGKMYAFEHYDIKPDILTLAKAMGGGMPIGAFMANKEIAETLSFGEHGTTYGGNPVACASALATMETLEQEDIPAQVEEKSKYFFEKLYEMSKDWPVIKELRGKGLMIGVELTFPGQPVIQKMFEKGTLGNVTVENTIRLVPPLIISKQEIDRIVDVLETSIREAEKEQENS